MPTLTCIDALATHTTNSSHTLPTTSTATRTATRILYECRSCRRCRLIITAGDPHLELDASLTCQNRQPQSQRQHDLVHGIVIEAEFHLVVSALFHAPLYLNTNLLSSHLFRYTPPETAWTHSQSNCIQSLPIPLCTETPKLSLSHHWKEI